MTVDREELRRLCEAATPVTDDMIHRYDHGGGRVMVFTPYRDLVADFYSEKDRECWIAARTALPALLTALEEAEAREKRLRELLAIYVHAHKSGNAVPPNIDGDARKALAETAP